MKLAHFSDTHVTHFPLSGRPALKRLAAVVSYSVMGRGRHFEHSDQRIAALLDDVDSLGVDHALCTGDLTGVSTEAEFQRQAQLWGERLRRPEKYTCIPGNHDRYVASADGLFEKYFAQLCEGARFPFVKQVPGGVSIVGIDVARPTSIVDSSGLVGVKQLAELQAILTDPALHSRFVVLALHYGLLRKEGQRDARNHGLRDDLELMALVDRDDVSLDLIVHGHMHRPFVVKTKRRTIINAGSATDLHVKGLGYNVYEIDSSAHRVTIERRTFNIGNGRYEADTGSGLNRVIETR